MDPVKNNGDSVIQVSCNDHAIDVEKKENGVKSAIDNTPLPPHTQHTSTRLHWKLEYYLFMFFSFLFGTLYASPFISRFYTKTKM